MLRKLEQKDISYMIEWMHDPLVYCQYRTNFKDMTEDNARDFIESSLTDKNINFAFTDSEDNYLGTISLKNISAIDHNAEYAIVTRRIAQGTDAAFNATIEILRYAFQNLSLHKVYLNVLEKNKRANRFYEKLGFIYEGKFAEHLFIRGEYYNINWYGMTKEHFLSLYDVFE